jgi:hypothetical protein
MNCDKHKAYKGTRKPKYQCKICEEIYRIRQKAKNEEAKFHSITTPQFGCGLIHVLAEIFCLMLFGQLPPYFWRKSSGSNSQIVKTYGSIYAELSYWYKKDTKVFNEFYKLFHLIYDKRRLKMNVDSIVENHSIEKQEKPKRKVVIDILSENTKQKVSKWKALKGLGDDNAEKEKE